MEAWTLSRFLDVLRCFSFLSDLEDFLKREKKPIVKEVFCIEQPTGEAIR